MTVSLKSNLSNIQLEAREKTYAQKERTLQKTNLRRIRISIFIFI